MTVTINDTSEKLSFTETATYFLADGKELGKFASSNNLQVADKIETVGGRGKFTPFGGQSAAEVGFVCAVPTTGKSLTAVCHSGVAQIFKSLDLSIASVVPFTLTSASNKDGAKVTFKGTQSDVRTGPAGSLTITAPKPGELGIGGGGTVYTSTALSGFRIQVHFVSADADVTERDGFDRGCKIFLQGIDQRLTRSLGHGGGDNEEGAVGLPDDR